MITFKISKLQYKQGASTSLSEPIDIYSFIGFRGYAKGKLDIAITFWTDKDRAKQAEVKETASAFNGGVIPIPMNYTIDLTLDQVKIGVDLQQKVVDEINKYITNNNIEGITEIRPI